MRYIKLSVSLLISIIGLVVYFVTIPEINEEEFVQLTVQAGDKSILDDYSFNGYIFDYGSFQLTSEDVFVPENLPFLEKLDATDNMETMVLKEAYPDFVNPLVYSANTLSYLISSDEEYLTSAHMDYQRKTYEQFYSKLYLRIFNKESKKFEEDIVNRAVDDNVSYTSIIGLYENYPEVTVLLDSRITDNNDSYKETGELSLLSYNIETKNMTEEVIFEAEGYIESTHYVPVLSNQSLQLFHLYDPESGERLNYLLDYTEDKLTQLTSGEISNFISDDNRLYSLEGTSLIEYDKTGQEKKKEVPLSIDSGEFSHTEIEVPTILDGKLFIIKNNEMMVESQKSDVRPSKLVVYDIATGDILVEALFNYDGTKQVDAMEAFVFQVNK